MTFSRNCKNKFQNLNCPTIKMKIFKKFFFHWIRNKILIWYFKPMIKKLWIMFYFWNNCNINFPVFDAYNVNFQELQLDFIFRIMPPKQIFGHGAIVFRSHPYQMANPKSILEMWLAGLGMAKILAIRQRWTLNGMMTAQILPQEPLRLNDWAQTENPFTGNQFGQRPFIFGLVHFGLDKKSNHRVINYQRIFSEIIRCYQPR